MNFDSINRVHHLGEEAKRLAVAYRLLGHCKPVEVHIPTGSFDGVTGKNHSMSLTLSEQGRKKLRDVVFDEYLGIAEMLIELGVMMPSIDQVAK